MKKIVLISLMFLAMGSLATAQVIEDFEVIPMNVMMGGSDDNSTIWVVPNPDTSGINKSNWVAQFNRDMNGVPWGGFFSNLPTPIDLTTNKYVHVKVWKTRISPVKFKVEGGTSGTLETFSMNPQTTVNAWEELVFDFSTMTGTYPIIAFMPDFEDPLTLTEDIVIYFDDITINNDPTVGSAAVDTVEDFEMIPMNLMLGDPLTDSSSIVIVPNPDTSVVNNSFWVARFIRDWNGVPWGGFWSPTAVDVTNNSYVHAKVWKNRISPLKFKIEGGAAGNLETFSMMPQSTTQQWEDIVFDFSSKTGVYPTISFMPDFEDPLTLTQNDTIYFDDIVLNDNPNPYTSVREMSIAGKISAYPVPFTDKITINANVAVTSMTITSMTGQAVVTYNTEFTGIRSFNTSRLASGVYLITFWSGNTSYSMKVMKQ